MSKSKDKHGFGGTYIPHMQEDFSLAYIQSICAVTGFNYVPPARDNDGIDVQIRGKGFDTAKVCLPKLDVQLKCLSGLKDLDMKNGFIRYKLRENNYNKLTNTIYPSILVVHLVPNEPHEWIQQNDLGTTLRYTSYWYSLAGNNNISGSKTIKIPFRQVLNAKTLCDMMKAVSQGSIIYNIED